jgi:8-hydroxy-5-deazaflavin:NADPH oxidoreductase
MKIGIIGAGDIGGTLARKLVALGHSVFVANSRGPETLAALAAETGATAVSVAEAAKAGEVVIVTIPEAAVAKLPSDLFAGVADSVVVVDTGNYYPEARDGRIEEIEASQVESQWVAQRLGRPVVKAFNNITHTSLLKGGSPAGTPGRIALPVAGDQATARAVVLQLVDQLGFDGVDTGGLDESWRQQPGTPAYCRDLDAESLKRALAEADRGRIKESRAEADAMAKPFLAERARAAAGGSSP